MANSDTYPVVMFDPAPTRYMGVIGSASAAIETPGISEIGTGTGSAFVLGAAPYLGARVDVFNAGTSTAGVTIVTDATGVTLNGKGDRTITFLGENMSVSLLGVSSTRWHVLGNEGGALS